MTHVLTGSLPWRIDKEYKARGESNRDDEKQWVFERKQDCIAHPERYTRTVVLPGDNSVRST